MVQGINKEHIFNTDKNKEIYLNFINEINQQYEIFIIAYCIMTNHAHFLIKVDNIEQLSNFMHMLNTKYAIYYNKINDRVGYVFRDRFKLQEISSIEHFYSCVEYIHNNPVKAGMCNSQEKYKYSSFYVLYNKNRIELYDKINEIIKNNLSSRPVDDSIEFLEIKEDYRGKEEFIIEKVLKEHKITKYELLKKQNVEKLKEVILILNGKYEFSYRKMEEKLGISREKLRKLGEIKK